MTRFCNRFATGCWTTILRNTLVLGMCLLTAVCQASTPIRVTFINPSGPDNPFWNEVTGFMRTVARDLDIQLEVRYANDNRYTGTNVALEALQSNPKPDCLIYIYQRMEGVKILRAAEAAKVHSFIFNTDIAPTERETVGKPREKFKYWIGHMLPDDIAAGRILALQLIEAAKANRKAGKDGRIYAVALSGGRDSSAGLDRSEGLRQALHAHPEVILQQEIPANWDRQRASSSFRTHALLKRYPKTSLVWAASDSMALGAVEGIEANERSAGVDVVTGGIDWTPDGILAVKAGKLAATLGGHFMDGGWALVLAHDFLRGIDFASSDTTIRSMMQVVTQANVEEYLAPLALQQWETFDFRLFSKVYNRQLRQYDFSLNAVLKSRRRQ
jgi:ABC-type sugar transport system substrate-binding protein